QRAPTHELTRAHAVHRTRRRIAAAKADWATSASGLAALSKGHEEDAAEVASQDRARSHEPKEERGGEGAFDDAFTAELAAIDALLERSTRVLAGAAPARAQDPLALVYDLDWDEADRLEEWRRGVEDTRALPPLLAAAVAFDAWQVIEPLQRGPWLGALVVSGLLRARGKARYHLPCLNVALRSVPLERRRNRDRATRLTTFLEAATLGAGQGIKDHDRWRLARGLLERKLSGRRKHSKLPTLIDLVLARPLVSAGMIAAELSVTPRAAQDLIAALGIREMTGRGRYRAWGVL
ncbi:MAG TPA: RHE_PE00001 family protein, partial [Myxococcales bacterium]|nr:RHE_PE00001 family protein [Myxococcales bacterium]